MSKVIHIVGAPATGKSTLRKRLEAATGLPSIAIDDERVKVLLPGEMWPSRDELAWKAVAEHVNKYPASIVETSGVSERSRRMLEGHEVMTVMAKASPTNRLSRLRARAREGGPMIGNPQRYVQYLMRQDDPRLPADYIWRTDSPSDAEAGFGPIWQAAQSFVGVPQR